MAKEKRRQLAEINVVPYIDVMLVLLVIFMITTPIITQGVNVDLPDATAEPVDTSQEKPLVIEVTADGLYVMHETVDDLVYRSVDEVIAAVKKSREAHPLAPVVIGADKKTPYGEVVVLMAGLQNVGIKNVGLLTQDSGASDVRRAK